MKFEKLDITQSQSCPECGEKLHFCDLEYDYGEILEEVDCEKCGKAFQIRFVPVSIVEV